MDRPRRARWASWVPTSLVPRQVAGLVSALALCVLCLPNAIVPASSFPTLYRARNATSPVYGEYQGKNMTYMPVYTVAILDRVLSVTPEVGQFEANVEVLLQWEDRTAYAAMVASTERYHNLSITTCQKPCSTRYVKDLCCDEVFSMDVQFSNAVGNPTIVQSLMVGEDGHVYQGLQISGTFYQVFKLKNYPYGSLQAAISLRLSRSLYSSSEAVTILPVPVGAKYMETNNGNAAGNGWYVSDVQLVGNRPAYVRDFNNWEFLDPTQESSLMDWRGATLASEDVLAGKRRLSTMVALLDAVTPGLDVRFTLYVGSVDAFISTLPLALLALLNLAVFMTPLSDARARISFSIQLFFTTTATLLTQNFGGTNQLNAIQRLAVVIFAMLVFTVFSTLIWNGIYNYKEGKADIINDWNLVTGKWKSSEVVLAPYPVRDMSPMMSPRCEGPGDERVPSPVINGDGLAYVSKKVRTADAMKSADSMTGHQTSKSLGERLRDDPDFRASFCRFGDRMCLLACFIAYVVLFALICTESSNQELYGALVVADLVADIDAVLNSTFLGDINSGWI